MRYPNFVGPAYTSQSRLADAEDLVNWQVVQLQSEGAKVRRALYPTAGVERRLSLPTAPVRGLFYQQGRAHVVAGGKVSEFFSDYTVTERGDVMLDGNPVTMTTNGDGGGQLMITAGNVVYILDLDTNTLTPVPSAGAALMGAMLNSRFLVLDAQQSKLSASDVFDGLTWGAFTFTQRSTASDPWRALLVSTSTSKIYMIGEVTSDVYYDIGASPFPFAPITGSLIPWGTAAPFSAVDYRGRIMWLGQNKDGDKRVVALSGYTSADVISNEAMESALAGYARVDDAEGFVCDISGTATYVLNFPTARASWGFDDANGWHRLGTWDLGIGTYDVWHARCHALAFGKHVVGDRFSGDLYEASVTYGYDFSGAPLRRLRRTPGLQRELERIFYPGLRIYLDAGPGPATGPAAQPRVMYRYSNDGGNTWGSFRERVASVQGQYGLHVDFLLNGSAYDRVDEIVISDPRPTAIIDCFLLGMDE